MVRGGFIQILAERSMTVKPYHIIIALMILMAWIWGFTLGRRFSRVKTLTVIDTVQIVDTLTLLDTVFVYQGGELRLVKCDTAYFRWESSLGHSINTSWGQWYSLGVRAPSISSYASYGVGIGLGYYMEPFGFISWRFGRFQGWVKPYYPYAAGLSYMLLLW